MDYKTMTNEEMAQFLRQRARKALTNARYAKECYGGSSATHFNAFIFWLCLNNLLTELKIEY